MSSSPTHDNHAESARTLAEGFATWNLNPTTRHALVTTAIGGDYFANFREFSLNYWLLYAKRHNLGIIAINSRALFKSPGNNLNGAWMKLLAPAVVLESFPTIQRIALVDTDVIINPAAPNVFDDSPPDSISVVSQVRNIPFDLLETKKRIAYLRRRFYSAEYPLDSSLFASPQQEFASENLPIHDDLFCSGMLVLPIGKAHIFADWFREALARDTSGAAAWEQNFLNHKVLDHGCYWLPYEFQALWNLEMARHHASLYLEKNLASNPIAVGAVASTLVNCHFLHFAGSWYESDAWKNPSELVLTKLGGLESEEFEEYQKLPPTGAHLGKKLPEQLPPRGD